MNKNTIKLLNIDNLIVNIENPRNEPTSDETDAIYTLADDQDKKLLNLAKSIATDGLNPSENIIVSKIPNTNFYTVREGNRRITCLKVLKAIDNYPSIKNFNSFKKISNQINDLSIFTVNCCIINEDESVNKWISLKHTGENGGIGTVNWDADSKERFKEQTGQVASPGFFAYKFLQDYGYIFPKKPPITTLTRVLNSPYGKQYFKFYLVKGKLFNDNTPEEIFSKLSRLCELVLDTKIINSRTVNTNTEIETFIRKYFNDETEFISPQQTSLFNTNNLNTANAPIQPNNDAITSISDLKTDNVLPTTEENSNSSPVTPNLKEYSPDIQKNNENSSPVTQENLENNERIDINNTLSKASKTASTGSTNTQNRSRSIPPTSKRKTIIPPTFKIRTHETKINNLISELKQLDVENFPNACSVSLRVLIEISIDYYGESNNCFAGKHVNTLTDKLKLVKKHLSSQGYTDDKLVPFDKILLSPDTIYSTNTFNKYVHHVRFQATPSDLKIAWDNIQEFIEIFLAN